MVMNDSDSSWVAARAQEVLGIIETEHTRPSVVFRPRLENKVINWRAIYGELVVLGNSPDEAMRNFDKAWMKKTDG